MTMEAIGLSITDTGRVLGGDEKPISESTVWRMLRRGDLKKLRVGGRSLVTVDSIKAYAAKQMEAA